MTLSVTAKRKIRQLNAADQALYTHFKNKFDQLLDRFGREAMHREVNQLSGLTQRWFNRCVANGAADQQKQHQRGHTTNTQDKDGGQQLAVSTESTEQSSSNSADSQVDGQADPDHKTTTSSSTAQTSEYKDSSDADDDLDQDDSVELNEIEATLLKNNHNGRYSTTTRLKKAEVQHHSKDSDEKMIKMQTRDKHDVHCWMMTAKELDFTRYVQLRQSRLYPRSVRLSADRFLFLFRRRNSFLPGI